MPSLAFVDAVQPQGTVIEIDKVSKTFSAAGRKVIALDCMSLNVVPGQITGLVGADGAGKTTVMRLCAGLLVPDSGTVSVFGLDSVSQAQSIQARVGYMPQRFGLYEDLSVMENLNLYANLHGVVGRDREDRYQQLLEFTGLAPFTKRLAGRLSGGMKQKLGLACVLVKPPSLLLLDEPTVGVDPVSRRELWQMVDLMVGHGTTVLVSTAYLDEAERCNEVLLMHQGRLLERGSPASFRARLKERTYSLPAQGCSRRWLREQAISQSGVQDAVIQGGRVRILMQEGRKPEPITLPEGHLLKPESVEPRFEDAFVALLTSGKESRAQKMSRVEAAPAIVGAEVHSEDVIELKQLERNFGEFRAVKEINLKVGRGEIFGLLGPNGAGKSTVIRMLCGLLPPSNGLAHVLGLDLARAPGKIRSRIGYMSQRFSLYRQLSVYQNFTFFAGAYGLRGSERQKRINDSLSDFGLEPYAEAVSGDLPLGYKQRLALACALLHRPQIVFLDEPTSGVDPLARREFWTRINALAEAGATVLVTTHFLEEAEYCDRLAIMYEGNIIAEDTPERLKQVHGGEGEAEPTLEEVFVGLVQQQTALEGKP